MIIGAGEAYLIIISLGCKGPNSLPRTYSPGDLPASQARLPGPPRLLQIAQDAEAKREAERLAAKPKSSRYCAHCGLKVTGVLCAGFYEDLALHDQVHLDQGIELEHEARRWTSVRPMVATPDYTTEPRLPADAGPQVRRCLTCKLKARGIDQRSVMTAMRNHEAGHHGGARQQWAIIRDV